MVKWVSDWCIDVINLFCFGFLVEIVVDWKNIICLWLMCLVIFRFFSFGRGWWLFSFV